MHETAPLLVQTIAIAIVLGILAQVVAEHLRLPSIVFLLVFGVAAGPDGLGWIDTGVLGSGLPAIVTVAVALILFEGGLQLQYLDLAAVGRTVRNLVTIGAVVTVLGATLAAHALAGFPWRVALLFGAIVSVTGPTVINPLLDRVRVKRRVDTILRGEGIVIDPIGAILAVVVLELIVTAEISVWDGLLEFLRRMVVGASIGLAGGWLLGRVLRLRRLLSDDLKNLVVLAWVLALFAGADAVAGESGLTSVVLAGMAVGRESIPRKHELRRFKGELSILFISILFILLSAHLPLATLAAVGWSGVWTVVVLMLIVRPLNVLASTMRTEITWRERLFVMWICPRGVVAISIASFIAILLEAGSPTMVEAGLTGADGEALLALVFMTIAITVLVQGSTAGAASKALGVHAEAGNNAIIVGADALGRTVGLLLKQNGWKPLLIDTNPWHCQLARDSGLAAVVGSGLDRDVLGDAQAEDATALISLTGNQAVNFLVAQQARDACRVPAVYPVLVDPHKGTHEELVERLGGALAFGHRVDVERWNHVLLKDGARAASLTLGADAPRGSLAELDLPEGVLPVLVVRGGKALICHADLDLTPGDRLIVLVDRQNEDVLTAIFGRSSALEMQPAGVA